MTNEEWQDFVEHLVGAKRELARAWSLVDGIDGATDEAERAFSRATEAIDDVYRFEAASDWNADVASPQHMQEFWDANSAASGLRRGNIAPPPLLPGWTVGYRTFGPSV